MIKLKNLKNIGILKIIIIDYTVSYYEYKDDWLVKDKDGKFPKKVNEKVIPEEIKKISR